MIAKFLHFTRIFAVLLIAVLSPVQLEAQVRVVPVPQQLPPGELPPESNPGLESGEQTSQPGAVQITGPTTFQPVAIGADALPEESGEARERAQENLLGRNVRLRRPPPPGEFEDYVAEVSGKRLKRFGQDLLLASSRDFAAPATATVPPEYRLNVGDKVVLYLTGSVGGTVERTIDNDGNIFLPSVGSVRLAGVRYADLRSTVTRAIGAEYRFFDVSVSIKSLKGLRVYVTGFANNPGAFTLSSLATVTNAVLQAGGPNSGGSFRSIKVYRNGREIGTFDLYRLLRSGNREGDLVLQNEDVLFIPPAGEQVAVLGSVQEAAIYELLPGESLADALQLAGGPNVLGDRDRLILYRTSDATTREPIEVQTASSRSFAAKGGDIIEVLSRGSLAQPIARQSILVRVEGEVARPGIFHVKPNSTLDEVLALAGGPTERAYLFGTRLERVSVRAQQSESFKEAIDQFRLAITAAPLEGGLGTDAAKRDVELRSAREVLDLLAEREPDGRVVMQLAPDARALPAGLMLENNDRLLIPAMPSTIGVFGAVYRPASFLIEQRGLKLGDYIEQAGGVLRAGDKRRAFVLRANGAVLTRAKGMLRAPALPGDVVFVPVRARTSNVWERIREITSIIFQLGLSAAVVQSID